MSNITDKFLRAQNELVTQSSDLSLESIALMVETGAIDISPGYQRRERWTTNKESALIESFLLNIPVPPVYLAEDEYGKYSIIDGKQRVTAINKFMKRDMKLSNLERFAELEGFNFSKLPPELKNAISIRPYIRVITLLKQSDPNLKYEVFTRLNTGGDNLLPQEIRNVAFRGPMNDLIFDLCKNEFLRKQLKIVRLNEKAYQQMADAEYVLRFFTLRESWNKFPGNMNIAMNIFMDEYQFPEDTTIKSFRELFLQTINMCEAIWGDNAFLRPDGEAYRKQMLQGIYDVQMVPLSFFLEKGVSISGKQMKRIKDAYIHEYHNNDAFQDAIRQFTSNPEKVGYRIGRMAELIEGILKTSDK